LFAKIAMAIWFQVSGFRCQEACSPEGTIHHLRHTLPFPQLTARGVLALGLSAPMFSPIHSTYECILYNDPEFLIFIDLKILHVYIIAMGHLVSP
jgi:hypothetical protein